MAPDKGALTTWGSEMNKILVSAVVVLASLTSAWAQVWEPRKNVEIVVYAAPDGSNDKTARAIEKAVGSKKLIKSTMPDPSAFVAT